MKLISHKIDWNSLSYGASFVTIAQVGSFRFECLSNFNVFFIPMYVFWCGKPKNDNHFVEKLFINTWIGLYQSISYWNAAISLCAFSTQTHIDMNLSFVDEYLPDVFFFIFKLCHRLSIVWVCAPVVGSTKFSLWFTVRCWKLYPFSCSIPLYAFHWSLIMVVPG